MTYASRRSLILERRDRLPQHPSFRRLRAWRNEEALGRNVPRHLVLGDSQIVQVIAAIPLEKAAAPVAPQIEALPGAPPVIEAGQGPLAWRFVVREPAPAR